MTTGTRSRRPLKVAISASSSPDIAAFGLSEGHLRDALSDLILQVLAADMSIAYGGDLRVNGLTDLLFELVMRYTSSEDVGVITRVENHLPWPVHIRLPVRQMQALADEMRGVAELVLIDSNGCRMTFEARRDLITREPSTMEWITGLTAMRQFQVSHSDLRIVMGGQVEGYKGRMPGVAEEVLLSILAGQPTFLVGGFGGSTRDVAETLGLAETWSGSRGGWPGQSEFQDWTFEDLNNGLTREENERLATTPFLGVAIVLILKGLFRLSANRLEVAGETDHA